MKDSLYFVYGQLLEPQRLRSVVPEATLETIAHLPGHRLGFSPEGTPVVTADDGHTVWGGVFIVPSEGVSDVVRASGPDAVVSQSWAVDRDGNRLEVAVVSGPDGGSANAQAVEAMITGARHWELPTGWIVGLEDLLDPFEF